MRREDQQDLAARALFSATEMANPSEARHRVRPQPAAGQVRGVPAALSRRLSSIRSARSPQNSAKQSATASTRRHPQDLRDLTFDNGTRPRDAWNTPLRIEPDRLESGASRIASICVRSAGPDREFDSARRPHRLHRRPLRTASSARPGRRRLARPPDRTRSRPLQRPRRDTAARSPIQPEPSFRAPPSRSHQISTAETRTAHATPLASSLSRVCLPGATRSKSLARLREPLARASRCSQRDRAAAHRRRLSLAARPRPSRSKPRPCRCPMAHGRRRQA